MKGLVAIALASLVIALPVSAQRGGSRGGFSGHGGSGSRGGFAASASRAVSGYRGGYSAYRGMTASRAPMAIPGLQRSASGYAGARAPYSYHHRRPYVSPYGSRFIYGISGYGVPGPYILDYPDGYDYDSASAAPDNNYQGYDMQLPPYPEQPADAPGVYPQVAVAPQMAPALTNEDGVTLVFKDGRAPVQIHDYVLTRNTVYVWDKHQRVIPIDQIDMVATAKANSDAGIDFELPDTAK